MPDELRKHGHGLLIAFVIAALILYPLSVGPIAWLELHTNFPEWIWDAVEIAYYPLTLAIGYGPESLRSLHHRYIGWWTPLDSMIMDGDPL